MSALAALGLEPADPEPTDPPVDPPVVDEPEETIEVPEGANNPDAVKNAIAAERQKAKAANARAREMEARLAEAMKAQPTTDDRLAALEAKLADAESKAAAAELNALRTQVAHASGLPQELASRLVGSTLEELQADAEKLSSLTKAVTSTVGMDGGFRETPPVAVSPDKAHNDFVVGLLQQARGNAQL